MMRVEVGGGVGMVVRRGVAAADAGKFMGSETPMVSTIEASESVAPAQECGDILCLTWVRMWLSARLSTEARSWSLSSIVLPTVDEIREVRSAALKKSISWLFGIAAAQRRSKCAAHTCKI